MKRRINLSQKELIVLFGFIMMILSLLNWLVFGQDWLGVCEFAIGCIGVFLGILLKG